MHASLLPLLNPHASAEQWLSDFWATHQKQDCDDLLWSLLLNYFLSPVHLHFMDRVNCIPRDYILGM